MHKCDKKEESCYWSIHYYTYYKNKNITIKYFLASWQAIKWQVSIYKQTKGQSQGSRRAITCTSICYFFCSFKPWIGLLSSGMSWWVTFSIATCTVWFGPTSHFKYHLLWKCDQIAHYTAWVLHQFDSGHGFPSWWTFFQNLQVKSAVVVNNIGNWINFVVTLSLRREPTFTSSFNENNIIIVMEWRYDCYILLRRCIRKWLKLNSSLPSSHLSTVTVFTSLLRRDPWEWDTFHSV